jgi:hypothetical protein
MLALERAHAYIDWDRSDLVVCIAFRNIKSWNMHFFNVIYEACLAVGSTTSIKLHLFKIESVSLFIHDT